MSQSICSTVRFVAVLAMSTLLGCGAGCAIGPDYQRPSIATPATFKETPADSLANGNHTAQWWTLFDDKALDELAHQVEVSNQNLAAAEAASRAARALVTQQRAAFFPSITLEGDTTHANGRSQSASGSAPPSAYAAGAAASWELDVWGRLRRSYQNARANAQASEADYAAARLSNQALLATTYLQLREADAELQLIADTITTYAKALQVTQNRYAAGVAAKTDVLNAQTQLFNAQGDGVSLTLQRSQYEHAIADLIGKAPADFTLRADPQWQATVPVIPATVPSDLLKTRPDIAAAEKRVAAASANIGVQEAAWFPSLTLSGAYSFTSDALATLFDAAARTRSATLAAGATLFDAGAIHGRVAAARAAYDQAVAEYRQAVLDGFRSVEDQLAATTLLAREHDLRRQAADSANELERLTMNQYFAGKISYTDVATSQAAAFGARRTLAQIVLARQSAAVSLVSALGGGWQSAEAQ
jgi:NodT family efflux transporter outer membrane factor (OMF) lipoprotein